MAKLPVVGTARDDIDKSGIVAASFHPDEDVWWVQWRSPPAVVTVTDRVVTRVETRKTSAEAGRLFLEHWKEFL